MAYTKPAIIITAAIALVGITALAAVAVDQGVDSASEAQAFGIRATDPVFPFKRQSAWRENQTGIYAVKAPRPRAGFDGYAVSYDKSTNRICAVYATTQDAVALEALKTELAVKHSQSAIAVPHGLRWSNNASFVEIRDMDSPYQIIHDFTGTCVEEITPRG